MQLTFLFTDIQGSTQRWEHHPEAMRAALKRHDSLLRQAIESREGEVFKTVGDAFCAVFALPEKAVSAAIAAQRAVGLEDWHTLGKEFPPLTVRMGLHSGPAEARDGDYFGPALNRTARLEAAGHGGQILISSATRRAIEAQGLPDGVTLRSLGEHRLSDLRHSEHILQVEAEGLSHEFPALRTAGRLDARDRIMVAARDGEAGQGQGRIMVERSVAETLADLKAVLRGEANDPIFTSQQLRSAAMARANSEEAYRLSRVAEWSRPRFRLDGRFVDLQVLLDQGEDAILGRWQPQGQTFDGLLPLLDAIEEPALVLLGPPGSGKSTLLRRLELDLSIAGVRAGEAVQPITLFAELNQYGAASAGLQPPSPEAWLEERWAARSGGQSSLASQLERGRVVLLLDGLNEMPQLAGGDTLAQLRAWKNWLLRLTRELPGNRIIFSCRALDYSQPLSTPDLRVPQVQIEPLDAERIRAFLRLYCPARWREIVAGLEAKPDLGLLPIPYFLSLLAKHVEQTGEVPEGRAELFTSFVRQSLKREVERGSPLFQPGRLLNTRDLRRIARWTWKGTTDLPERGLLLRHLASLAHAMQAQEEANRGSQLRIDLDTALELLDTELAEEVIAAGQALATLDEDEVADEIMFVHQLLQEYFAARELARAPDPGRLRRSWRAAEMQPKLEHLIAELDPADPLPGPPQTGWEETVLLAAVMSEAPEAFVSDLLSANLCLAGRCAAEPELRGRLDSGLMVRLRKALLDRLRDPEADLRERIACAEVLGHLDDPRIPLRQGQEADYREPPMVDIAAGSYPIGHDEPIEWVTTGASGVSHAHVPRCSVQLSTFAIGRFPVTNGEWACFMEAGGYADERWWALPDAKRWWRGELPNEAYCYNNRLWRQRFMSDPALFETLVEEGRFADEEAVEEWRRRMTMSDAAFEQELAERFKGERLREPMAWGDPRFSGANRPVIGISWYEAQAYCRWLSAQTGLPYRLPTEAEREAAARGREGRRFPWGEDYEPLRRCNTEHTHLRRTSPVGVFPEGDSPEGVCDLAGNVYDWTSSIFGTEHEQPDFRFPYQADDGREDLSAGSHLRRVARGGAWCYGEVQVQSFSRVNYFPDYRYWDYGFRLALSRD